MPASSQAISSKISAAKTYNESSKSSAKLKKSLGDSASESAEKISTQLNKIRDTQKRYLREPPTSMDGLLNFLGQTKGKNGAERKKLFQKAVLTKQFSYATIRALILELKERDED